MAAADAKRSAAVEELGRDITLAMLLAPALDTELKEAPKEVWHYTDAAGAAGIVAGRELWATDALFMNDASELQLVYQDFEAVLTSDVNDAFLRAGERERMLAAFEASVQSFREDPGLFVVCFCESGDLLSQWNSYGREGGGFALAFDSHELAGYDKAVIGTLDFFRVIYERDEQVDAVATFSARALNHLESFLDGCEPGDRKPALELTGEGLAQMAQWFSARIKEAAFKQEREWRFICRRPSKPGRPADYQREFRPTPRGLVPFVRLPLGRVGKDAPAEGEFPLTGIRVGPTANIELASRAINYMLKDHGFAIEAKQSRIPLRT